MIKYYKLVFEDMGSLFDRGFKYKIGEIKECDDFNPEPVCGHGLHYGDLINCIEDGLNNLSIDYSSINGIQVIDNEMLLYKHKFKLLEVKPIGRKIKVNSKFKTNRLKIIREIPAEECVKLFMTDKNLKVRRFGLVYLSLQNNEIKKRFEYYLNEYDDRLNCIREWNFFKDLKQFINKRVHYNEHTGLINHIPLTYAGKITEIDEDLLLAKLDNEKFINIYWLKL